MGTRPKETARSGVQERAGRLAAAALLIALAGCSPAPDEAPAQPASREPGAPAAAPAAGAPSAPAPAAARLPSAGVPAALRAELARRPVAELARFADDEDAAVRRIAARALGRVGGDEAAQLASTLLRDADALVRVEACFAIGVTGSANAAGLLGPILESKPAPAEVAAAAMGLGHCKDDAAGHLLVRLALREDLPVEAPESLFRHARMRGRPWPGPLPDAGLLRYEKHASPRGRAAIGTLGRFWKDPQLLPALERLAKDADPEVRRATALGLADGKAPDVRPAADADRAMAALAGLAKDADARVVVAACRAAASYEREDAVALLTAALANPNFHVRTAASEGLGARKSASTFDVLARLSAGGAWGAVSKEGGLEFSTREADRSVSVRYAAAKACLAIDAKRAQKLAALLLADPSDFVRSGGAEVLAASEDPAAVAQLIALATKDPSVRVREAALDGLKEKKTPEAQLAVKSALEGEDPVVVSVAADVVATNGWTDLAPLLRTTFARHPGTKGADAREGIVTALGKLGLPEDAALLAKTAAEDAEPSVRLAAGIAAAERAGTPPPAPERRPRPEGEGLPLGAKLLERDVDLIVETDQGTMRIRLDASEAPLHAAHLADLAAKGFYDGLTWHRVVPDFVIQGGCPRGDGAGNAGVTLPLEPTRTPFERGTLGMPRSSHPDSGGCQLFICHSRAPHLDVQYAAIGRVVEGLDVIDKIDVGSKIVRVRVAETR